MKLHYKQRYSIRKLVITMTFNISSCHRWNSISGHYSHAGIVRPVVTWQSKWTAMLRADSVINTPTGECDLLGFGGNVIVAATGISPLILVKFRWLLPTALHIVIVNSRFLQRPQKRSRGNRLIHTISQALIQNKNY